MDQSKTETVACRSNGMLLSKKWEQTTDKHSKMEESVIHYAKCKKPNSKASYTIIHICDILKKAKQGKKDFSW